MYTISALWTHAREHLNITTIILKNSSYGILREEWACSANQARTTYTTAPDQTWAEHRSTSPGWPKSMGVPAAHADPAEELVKHLTWAMAEPGPHLIEAVVPAIV